MLNEALEPTTKLLTAAAPTPDRPSRQPGIKELNDIAQTSLRIQIPATPIFLKSLSEFKGLVGYFLADLGEMDMAVATSASASIGLWSRDMMIDRARALLRWRSHDLEHGSAIPEPTTKLLTAAAPTPDRPSRQVGSVIYEVPYRLRQVKEIAYEPNVISIGPYHHDGLAKAGVDRDSMFQAWI
ncbi:hypothetical protein V6N11_029721 [Hibiscus sabdariffa]|uniref:Uncharacterized protein n=1 Tax=Hibiscus sabdariffa TaxID=183260 RepID=A0ABR2P822_9ROSI